MGIYIPNFEIPKDGYRQLFLTAEGEIIWYPTSPQNGDIKRQVIPVPDHGRLIDADDLIKRMTEEGRAYALCIATAPTIIPPDKECN